MKNYRNVIILLNNERAQQLLDADSMTPARIQNLFQKELSELAKNKVLFAEELKEVVELLTAPFVA